MKQNTLLSLVPAGNMTPLRNSARSPKKMMLLSLLMAGTASVGSAAVISPQIGGSIDPGGGADVDFAATGSVALATFATTTGSEKVIQANWQGAAGTTGNTVDHDAGGLDDGVDVRIGHSGGLSASPNTSDFFNTAGVGTGYQWSGTSGQSIMISFGTQDGSFSNDRTVLAAGLVLLNFGSAYTNVAINYFDSDDNNLSSQFFGGTGDPTGEGGADVFTGYISSSPNISYLTIDLTRTTGSSNVALDAVTFVVPEPSSAALLGLGSLGLLLGRKRRVA